MTWRHTGLGPAGTPRRPNRPTTTWPSNSGGSSSPPDFATHALARPPRKKPKPSSQPGPQPEHDQPKLRKTRDLPALPATDAGTGALGGADAHGLRMLARRWRVLACACIRRPGPRRYAAQHRGPRPGAGQHHDHARTAHPGRAHALRTVPPAERTRLAAHV